MFEQILHCNVSLSIVLKFAIEDTDLVDEHDFISINEVHQAGVDAYWFSKGS